MEERVTDCKIELKVIDITAKEDSKASFQAGEYCRESMFRTDNPSCNWATCEWNGFVLDGSMNLSDENGQKLLYPYVSPVSDANGRFEENEHVGEEVETKLFTSQEAAKNVIYSSAWGGREPYKAFDGNKNSFWSSKATSNILGQYIGYDFGSLVYPANITISYSKNGTVVTCYVQGLDANGVWQNITEELTLYDASQINPNTLTLDSPDGAYSAFRILFTSGNQGFYSGMNVHEIKISGHTKEIAEDGIMIEFSKPHSSNGITLLFDGAVPEAVLIEWYGRNQSQINRKEYYPDSSNFYCENNVRDFTRLKITFSGTKAPYARVKLANIEYGSSIMAEGDMLREGTITEEVDPVSSEISINTLGFTIYDQMEEFNPLDFKGKYFGLQEGQKVYVTEAVDGKPMMMGTYYIQTWESNNEHEITFQCIDLIGQINKTDFKKSRMYMDEKAGTVIDEIMASAKVTDYLIEEELTNVLVNGYIPVCTHREAIQQVAFAIRAVVECDRDGKIRFYRIENVASGKISSDRLFMDGGKIKVKDLICGIDVTTHTYTVSQEQEKVFEGILPKGKSEILFGSPATGITLEHGQIVEAGTNYAIVSMEAEGNVTVSGYKYQDNTAIYHISVDGEENTAKVQDATLISKYNVHLLAEHLLKYYALRKEAEQEYIMDTEKTGRWINMKLQNNNIVSGCIEKQVIDLTGGFLSTATVVGYNTVVSDFPFTGMEIYTGEQIGVV